MYTVKKISDITESEYEYALSLMTDTRRASIERMRSPDDRRRSALGELTAKRLLSSESGLPIESVALARTERGKPYFVGGRLELSISHSGDFVAVAVGTRPVGIDIEVRREINPALVRKVCTERETEFVTEDGEIFDERFLTVWTAKEAYFKYIGTGITALKEVDYFDIKDSCETVIRDEYILTVYE